MCFWEGHAPHTVSLIDLKLYFIISLLMCLTFVSGITSLAAKGGGYHQKGTLEEVRAVRGVVTVLYPLMNDQ